MNSSNLQSNDFITNYLIARGGTSVPKCYNMWAAIHLVQLALGPKCFIDRKHFKISSNLYIFLIGSSGGGKSTAKDWAQETFTKAFPDYPLLPSITSADDTVRCLAGPMMDHNYVNHNGETCTYRPIAGFINEFKNFSRFDIEAMITFSTDIFDTKHYRASTIKRGLEDIPFPWFTMLACAVPKWITDQFRLGTFNDGFVRRTIFVSHFDPVKSKIAPSRTPESYVAEGLCPQHLQEIAKLVGEFTFTEEAEEKFKLWWEGCTIDKTDVLEGYYETKHVVVQKVAMAVAAAQKPPSKVITWTHVQTAIALLEANEANLPTLVAGSGQNRLVKAQVRLLKVLKDNGGIMSRIAWQRLAWQDLDTFQYDNVMKMLLNTKQIRQLPRMEEEEKTDPKTGEKKKELVRKEDLVVLAEVAEQMIRDGKIKGVPL